ncbi:4-(cytidine 5'-diphospho)-2-C-methyl-D-erythritol kinase [Sphingomonas spermidinifaciens]|uniref:4-diphosphocytidyl-2-C-methyl-D-erythritol kinase n=1 Tax=Sphingomonas spermidinifaciens TaxID=1141889 RepID=A0A2A4B7A6_9SPHN|nr:4-(cytidine 5'-diphospho)-2-C-methyl-D-erythritol kinase [Sphingomonas spermidinifaciens]PCD03526.1 4-(cytidine 5'-diphospho)-2-C-methyl-D-erythritol kinase [Sphingomonas spermidinifaciens]
MIEEAAPAKLNLALHVRARRPDGYHELETLFAFVADGDTIRLDTAGAPGLTITGPFAGGLSGEADNLVLRAERLFAKRVKPVPRAAIELVKRLPVASGIGGGSADAAATLRALARAHGVANDDPRLVACAEALGSDVPACLLGRAAVGRGRGERLEPLPPLPPLPVLLVNPRVPVSTAAVFARWDGTDRGPVASGDPIAAALAGRNDLEPPARVLAPAIERVLALLAAQPGVILARMSGSGATCFALFDDRARCSDAAAALAPDGWWCLETALA